MTQSSLLSFIVALCCFMCLVQCFHLVEKSDDLFKNSISQSSNQVLNSHSSDHFDYYVFTQTWPVSTCIDYDYKQCSIPANVTSWIIHGLWPDTKSGDNPFYCDDSYPFNDKEVEPIWGDLVKYWTNLFTDSDADSFWEHEWEKHGTCAMKGTSYINSEFDYFNFTLGIYFKFPVHQWLRSAEIHPSDTTGVNYTDVYDAITNSVGGKQVTIQCQYDENESKHILSAIEICLDKNINPIDCQGSSDQGCPKEETFIYPETISVFRNHHKKIFTGN